MATECRRIKGHWQLCHSQLQTAGGQDHGSTHISATAQINAVSAPQVLVGDVGSVGGALTPLKAPGSAFVGAVAFHGFVLGTAGGASAQSAGRSPIRRSARWDRQ